ncbi:hypothetical protein J2Y69_002448 [Microbacterium resistens]|uniref:PKD domain-containing protein n=1 Tax=Microbacterium resistens TaxID=156977 RepID=A0ABU1SE23_9MICO|nr:hypothetical protein [Microbacterium resistens]MDR6867840.1 hypothetical protein [Microbacterium resistens]
MCNDGGGVWVGAEETTSTTPGDSVDTGNGTPDTGAAETEEIEEGVSGPDTGESSAPTSSGTGNQGPDRLQQCLGAWNDDRNCFTARPPSTATPPPTDPEAPTPVPGPAAPQTRPVTISDLVRLAPAGVQAGTEPGNVAVVGLPANVVSRATAETLTATVLGRPIVVRFAPQAFDFSYGDGATATTTTGGADWATLGQDLFTPTATSHVYTARGVYTLSVTVHYSAEIDLGGGWTRIGGTVAGAPSSQEIRVFEARTALVGHACTERPNAPGC